MDIKVDEQQQPLLQDNTKQKTPSQKAIRKTFKGTAHLANLLPTGTVLVFQLMSPGFTNQGRCHPVNRLMTAALLAFCGASCFIMCFTDSFRDGKGKVRYGLATFRGLWVIDGSTTIPPEEGDTYRLRFIDFMHAFLSILVFVAVALFDKNVVRCFYPTPSDDMKELLIELPIGIGVICSILFVIFPTKRHGIGFPLSRQ